MDSVIGYRLTNIKAITNEQLLSCWLQQSGRMNYCLSVSRKHVHVFVFARELLSNLAVSQIIALKFLVQILQEELNRFLRF